MQPSQKLNELFQYCIKYRNALFVLLLLYAMFFTIIFKAYERVIFIDSSNPEVVVHIKQDVKILENYYEVDPPDASEDTKLNSSK